MLPPVVDGTFIWTPSRDQRLRSLSAVSGLGRSGHFARVWPARWPLLTRSGQPAGRDERARSGCEREVAFVPKLATAVRRALHDGVSRQLASARSRHEQWPDRTRTDTLLSVVRGCDPCRPGAAVQAERPQRSEDERPGRSAVSGTARTRPASSRNVTESLSSGVHSPA